MIWTKFICKFLSYIPKFIHIPEYWTRDFLCIPFCVCILCVGVERAAEREPAVVGVEYELEVGVAGEEVAAVSITEAAGGVHPQNVGLPWGVFSATVT